MVRRCARSGEKMGLISCAAKRVSRVFAILSNRLRSGGCLGFVSGFCINLSKPG